MKKFQFNINATLYRNKIKQTFQGFRIQKKNKQNKQQTTNNKQHTKRKMNRQNVRENAPIFAIVLFVVVFASIHAMKPMFLFNANGSIREFGVGSRNKTILPVWLLSIVLGIFSYLAVLYYVAHPKLRF